MSVTPFYRGQYGDNGMFGSVNGQALGNRGAFARFSRVAVPNESKSKDKKIPIFDEEVHCEILMPGDPLNIPKRRVKIADGTVVGQDYIDRFPKEWEAFEGGGEQMPEGTPLSQWPNEACTKGLVATLNAIHIYTVQQLAEIHDGVLEKVMGLRELRAEARAYCEAAINTGAAQKYAADAEASKRELTALQGQFSDLQKQMEMIVRGQQMAAGATDAAAASLTAASGVASPAPTDPLVAAALATGAKPADESLLRDPVRRGPGRPPKQHAA